MVVVYDPQVWADGEVGGTPVDADSLSHIEQGVVAAHTALEGKANATHSHLSSSIIDFAEAAQDAASQMFRAGSNVTLNYDDNANTFTINATGTGGTGTTDAEVVRDTIGAALVGGANIQIINNDVSDIITISVTGINADPSAGTAGLRSLGTGALQAASGSHTHSTGTTSTAGFISAADKAKLDSVAANANAYTAAQAVSAVGGKLWFGTQAQYDAIGSKDASTLYVIS